MHACTCSSHVLCHNIVLHPSLLEVNECIDIPHPLLVLVLYFCSHLDICQYGEVHVVSSLYYSCKDRLTHQSVMSFESLKQTELSHTTDLFPLLQIMTSLSDKINLFGSP